MEILLTAFFYVCGLYILKKNSFFRLNGLPSWVLQSVFTLKIACGFFLFFLYTNVYERETADIFKYYDDGKIMWRVCLTNPLHFLRMILGFDGDQIFREYYTSMSHWYRQYESLIYNDNRTIIRINALLNFLSFGYYHAHNIVWCFLALIGQTALYKFLKSNSELPSAFVAVSVFLIPTVLLWTSGNLKEVVLFFAMGLTVFLTNRFVNNSFNLSGLLLLGCTFLLWVFVKPYTLIIMVPCFTAYFFASKNKKLNPFFIYLTTWLIFVCITIGLSFSAHWNIFKIISKKQQDFIGLAKEMDSGSYIPTKNLEPGLIEFIMRAPQALYRAFFRPYFFESKSPLIIFSGLENFIFFVLLILSLLFRKKLNRPQLNFALFLSSFVIFNLLLIGYTTPVMGAIMRYKAPILPFMLTVLLTLIDFEKFKNSLFRTKNYS